MATNGNVLVTGGAGYIGSHVCVELINAGFTPVVVDNLCNSNREVMDRVETITGTRPELHLVDIRDRAALDEVFHNCSVDAVMHFAGLKAVGESSTIPLSYYQNNVAGSLTLFEAMAAHDVWKVIFSSSATVYGDPASVPIDESFPISATNPYGRTKLMVEEILRDMSRAPDAQWNTTLLRYFNPVGAHESGLIGEDPLGIPNNLVPYIAQVAVGKLPALQVFGDDYNTADGTGVRDYIHVVDLARGHVAALQKQLTQSSGCRVYNLGTGNGYSVLEVVDAFAKACGKEIPYKVAPRRAGDIARCYAKTDLAQQELGWKAEFGIERMMQDTWRWQSQNPNGYRPG
ncbi:UDP-glucose 4-epimerase GalE [Gilvimarinus xylanilyticus]|uniref:UDP-glucose 4-epimerase n=1 Tax=Gilvimarinus xylanilyticus TaxID=2944139 RepID=A0A9X2I3U6_9GAMM|nr:UDP-glucose 4-epimerase GalE [Gilvimarinus xylanilyticus]MCP8898957.1 UDP-glucose 4-epimerase GalE [Gilvimarinus xylanilyticus]